MSHLRKSGRYATMRLLLWWAPRSLRPLAPTKLSAPRSRISRPTSRPGGKSPTMISCCRRTAAQVPVVSDPRYPYTSFYRFQQNPNPTFRVADLNNIILQPSTKEALRKANEKALSGQIIAVPKERCWPVGVPAFLLYPATPVYFLQTPDEVTMIWMQDHQVRRIRLNEQHEPNAKPSWFGNSSATTKATRWSWIRSASPRAPSSTTTSRRTPSSSASSSGSA